MKVQVLQENLLKGVGVLSRLTTSGGKLPILSHILLVARPEGLWLSATDLELSVTIKLGAKVEEEGVVAVPARVMNEFLGSLNPGKMTLMSEGEQLQVVSENHKAKLQGMGGKEFPEIATAAEKKMFSFGKDFEEVVGSVALAAATDESRPALTGVLWKEAPGGLMMVATDGYRLSKRKVKVEGVVRGEWIVPARTLLEVAGLLKAFKMQAEVKVGVTKEGNQLVFELPEVVVVSRLISGEFPDVEQIIPDKGETEMMVDQEELLVGIRMAAIFARESANIVKLSIDEGGLVIKANSPQVGENESKVEAEVKGEGGMIAFNSRYLLDLLNTVKGKRVKLSMSGTLKPGLFTFEEIKDFVHVIMPVRVQEAQ